jgi:hypothetical protein
MVIANLSQKIRSFHSPEIVEALAAKQAITFALEVGIGHVFFEGDSEVIVRALCSLEAPPNVYGHIIDDV